MTNKKQQGFPPKVFYWHPNSSGAVTDAQPQPMLLFENEIPRRFHNYNAPVPYVPEEMLAEAVREAFNRGLVEGRNESRNE